MIEKLVPIQMTVNCIHHWDMGASHKGIVHARCRKCLAEADFYNAVVFMHGTFGGRKKLSKPPITSASNRQE